VVVIHRHYIRLGGVSTAVMTPGVCERKQLLEAEEARL
jgi:hypothetical protein